MAVDRRMYTRIIIVGIAFILCLPFAVMADCHDDSECENVDRHLIFHQR